MTIPSVSELRALLHYNQISGVFTYLQQRGPKKPGEVAGTTQGVSCVPYLYVGGRLRRAALVAWIMAHGADPSPQHVICKDGNPGNLALCNLALSDQLPHYNSPRMRRGRRPAWQRHDVKRLGKTGLWRANYNGFFIGDFETRQEALSARRLAAMEENGDA